jgi:hypothetical protein
MHAKSMSRDPSGSRRPEPRRNGGMRLTPWRRAGDAVGDPRELVLDGV